MSASSTARSGTSSRRPTGPEGSSSTFSSRRSSRPPAAKTRTSASPPTGPKRERKLRGDRPREGIEPPRHGQDRDQAYEERTHSVIVSDSGREGVSRPRTPPTD